MKICKILMLCILVVLVSAAYSCGYRFTPGGENIEQSIRSVYVDNFTNRTSEAGLENTFRNSFIDQFRKSSRFKLASSISSADAVLRGNLNNLSSSHLSYGRTDVAKEDRATVSLDVVFEKRVNKEIIWRDPNVTWYRDYTVDSTNPATTDANRKAALQTLADDVADRVYRSIMSGF
ncbi:MAG: LPS assembly lipoprotein LptE [Syntrophales bacterium]